MSAPERSASAGRLMTAFAERTGLESGAPQRRYLWTDAFAVGNFLGLARATGEGRWAELALRLIDAVHHQLGRHRPDDSRAGWISGRPEDEGEAHPTCGGLRIGKRLPERRADEPHDEALEWDRDGQYFHYLTRWMHALSQAARWTGMAFFAEWARQLGSAAHDAFVWEPPGGGGRKRMYWKMSIDLSRPLVASMGQHDALDGYVACLEAEAAASKLSAGGDSTLEDAQDFASMIDRQGLASPDPLGTGALLMSARILDQLAAEGGDGALVQPLLAAGLAGVEAHARRGGSREPPERRLAFRELGLAIGLEGVALMGEAPAPTAARRALLVALDHHRGLADDIVSFWARDQHQRGDGWLEHRDINEVMLATALAPQGFSSL